MKKAKVLKLVRKHVRENGIPGPVGPTGAAGASGANSKALIDLSEAVMALAKRVAALEGLLLSSKQEAKR